MHIIPFSAILEEPLQCQPWKFDSGQSASSSKHRLDGDMPSRHSGTLNLPPPCTGIKMYILRGPISGRAGTRRPTRDGTQVFVRHRYHTHMHVQRVLWPSYKPTPITTLEGRTTALPNDMRGGNVMVQLPKAQGSDKREGTNFRPFR